MTLHPVRLTGVVIGAPQTYSYFERIQERIVRFITTNSKIPRRKLIELMLKTGELAADVGSVIYGEEAVRLGLIDEVGGLSDALAYLHGRIDSQNAEAGPGSAK
jgi:ATP-dependent protease ClpP protease subunit